MSVCLFGAFICLFVLFGIFWLLLVGWFLCFLFCFTVLEFLELKYLDKMVVAALCPLTFNKG